MKPATLFLISLLIFVFTSPSLSRSILGEGDHLVFDAFGDPLEEGARYIIGPAVWGVTGGAGILSVSYENGACAAYVKKDSEQVSTGTPFTFRNIYPSKEKTIKLGYPVAILSPDENPCEDTTVWKVTDQVTSLNLTRGTKVISTGGNINAEYSCFKFTKPEPRLWPNSYFIEHAPHLCNGANVARKVGGYMGYYATNDSPEQYVFVKRDPAEFAAKLS